MEYSLGALLVTWILKLTIVVFSCTTLESADEILVLIKAAKFGKQFGHRDPRANLMPIYGNLYQIKL